MSKILWMSVERHPDSLRTLIRDAITASGFEVIEAYYEDIDELENSPLENIEAVLMAPARHFPNQLMDRLVNCKLIQIWSSGYDKFNIADAWERKIPVANNHGANAVSVAEHTILLLLGISRRIPEMHQRVITGKWEGNDHGMSSYSLKDKTLGIVGLGNIGTLVAHRAEALGMNILFSDPNKAETLNPNWQKREFDDLLGEVDYLTFHVHLTESTRNMLNAANITLLKKQPFVINVSRAELIDRAALQDAMKKNLLKGLAIDAHYEEPTKVSDPLFSFPNILMSPHVAGSTVDSYIDTITACLVNIKRAISGKAVEGLLASPLSHQAE